MPTVRKLVVVALFSISALSVGGWIYIQYSWAATKPAHPQAATGRIYRQDLHGTVFYVTKGEDRLLTLLQVLALGSGIAGGALRVRFGMYSHPLRGLSSEQQYKVLHGPKSNYKKVRDTYREEGR